MNQLKLVERFGDASPALAARFFEDTTETPTIVPVEHKLGTEPEQAGTSFLANISAYEAMSELVSFYSNFNGFELCRTFNSRVGDLRPLLELKRAEDICEFTNRYVPGGDLAWTIDLNKTRKLYRDSSPWIAFAEVDSGPACLTTFLDGENAGAVFYVAPQPEFNILRPIARSFQGLLERIAADVAAFLRLVRARITLRGQDEFNYGLKTIEYFPSHKTAKNVRSLHD